MKKRFLLTLDDNLVDKVKQNYKLSSLVNRLLKQFVEQTLSPEELQIRLGIINSKIHKQETQLNIKTKTISELENEACKVGERLIKMNK